MKVLSVPVSKEVEELFESDINNEAGMIDVFLNDSDYAAMWYTPLYDEINEELDVFIDDAEDEKIGGRDNLEKMLLIIKKYEDKIQNPIVPTLKSLTEAAIRFDTCVYFFF